MKTLITLALLALAGCGGTEPLSAVELADPACPGAVDVWRGPDGLRYCCWQGEGGAEVSRFTPAGEYVETVTAARACP